MIRKIRSRTSYIFFFRTTSDHLATFDPPYLKNWPFSDFASMGTFVQEVKVYNIFQFQPITQWSKILSFRARSFVYNQYFKLLQKK